MFCHCEERSDVTIPLKIYYFITAKNPFILILLLSRTNRSRIIISI
jgi:hypothetical protein